MRTALCHLSALLLATVAPCAYAQAAYNVRLKSPDPVEQGNYGRSLTGLDDVDGDARGDFAVRESGTGTAFVYSGGTLDLLHTINVGSATSLLATPDYDGDGSEDLLAAAATSSLFSGSTGALIRTYYADACSAFATAAVVPDADGDGVFDVLLTTLPGDGTACLLSGASGALLYTVSDPDAPPPFGSNAFGASATGIADADGDGRGDFVVSAPEARVDGHPRQGKVHVFSGATGTLLYTLAHPFPWDYPQRFGHALAAMPDIDGDGRGDFLVSDPQYGDNEGRIWIKSGASGSTIRVFPGVSTWYHGGCIAPIPDLDGDGLWDVAYSTAGNFVVVVTSTGQDIAELSEYQGVDRFGCPIAGIPDFDGDGLGEIVLGADLTAYPGVGFVYLYPSDERPAPTVDVEPIDPPVVVPAEGGAFSFTTSVESHSEIWQRWQVWGQAYGNGSPVGDELAPLFFKLYAGQDTTIVREQVVEAAAPAGEYEYRVYVGDYLEGFVVAEHAFPFTKELPTTAAEPPAEAPPLALSVAPNPVGRSATLAFTLPVPAEVRLALHDALGREVAVLVEGAFLAGPHEAVLDASALAPGVYVARLSSGGEVAARRVVVAR